MSVKWPKKGNKAFAPSLAPGERTRLEAFVMPSVGDYTAGFQRAADMIVDTANTDNGNPDNLFFPVAYLYRHHIELSLKDLVRLGVRLGALKDCEDCLGDHNLHKLWNKAKDLVQAISSTSPHQDIEATEHVILEFHKLDPDGQAFRYARTKNGEQNLQKAPDRVDLNDLKTTVDGVSAFLEAAYAGIDSCDPGQP